jgi:beta-N-acetylhexosaminidase
VRRVGEVVGPRVPGGRRARGVAAARRAALVAAIALMAVVAGCGNTTPVQMARAASMPTARAAGATPTTSTRSAVGISLGLARTDARVEAYLSHMSLDEKLGQMFLVESVYRYYSADVNTMVSNLHAGAMIIYAQNMSSLQQLHDYIATIQAHAALPMMVSMDEEGGVVDRLGPFDGPLPAAQDLAMSGDPHKAWLAAARAAKNMQALGINTDLAPVVDVRAVPNAVEYTRLFSPPDHYNDVAMTDKFAGAFLQGLQQNGEIACLKHWPGIGSTVDDPHLTLPTITRSRAQLEALDFAAFRNLLADQPGMIMVTHVMVPAIDSTLPATLSPKLVQGVLRGELGYDGVVMTDSLYMEGIRLHYSLGEAAVLSVLAGDDLLEGAWDSGTMLEMLSALKTAIKQGRISQARIDQSVRRILLLKERYGLLPMLPAKASGSAAAITAPVAQAMAADVPRA